MDRPSILKSRPIDYADLKLGHDYIIKIHVNPDDPPIFYYGKKLYKKFDDGYLQFKGLVKFVEYPNINKTVPIDIRTEERRIIEEHYGPYIVREGLSQSWRNLITDEIFEKEPPVTYSIEDHHLITTYYTISYPDMRDIGSGKRRKSNKKMKKSKSNKIRKIKRKTRKY